MTLALLCANVLCASRVKTLATSGAYALALVSRSVDLGCIEGKHLCRLESEVVDVTSCTGTDVDVKHIIACLKIYSTKCYGIEICPAGCCKSCVEYNVCTVKLCRECSCHIDVTVTCGVHTNSYGTIICYGNGPLEVIIAGVGCRYVTNSAEIEVARICRAFYSPYLIVATCCYITITSNLFSLFNINVRYVTLALFNAGVLCASRVETLITNGALTLASMHTVNRCFIECKSCIGSKYEVVNIAGCVLTNVDIKCILARLKVYCRKAFCSKGIPVACGKNSINCNLFAVKYDRECLGNINVSVARCIEIYIYCAIICNGYRPLEVVVAGICLGYVVDSAKIEVTRCICIFNSPYLVVAACCYITVTSNLFSFFHVLISTRNLCAAGLFLNESNLG